MPSARQVRLASGLILLAYVTTHLANHALGLISLDAMDAGRTSFLAVWRSPLGSLALYSSWTAHVALAFWALYQRRTLRMAGWEGSDALAADLSEPLRIGIGIHTGPAVVGRMGYAEAIYLTAVGDTVHVAARLESLTKEYDCELIFSEAVARRAGLATEGFARHEITLRNRAEPLTVLVVPSAAAVASVAATAR